MRVAANSAGRPGSLSGTCRLAAHVGSKRGRSVASLRMRVCRADANYRGGVSMFPDGDLAVALVDFDPQACRVCRRCAQRRQQLPADVGRQQLGRRVGDRQQPAVAAGKHPAAVGERGRHFAAVVLDANLRMLGRQQHVVIELGGDLAELRADQQKIDDELILVERPVDFGRHVIVVAVQPLARAAERDEMGRAEDVLGLGDANVIGLSHYGPRFLTITAQSNRPSRSSTNSPAAMRSAVVPGLRRWPSARSQTSNSASASLIRRVTRRRQHSAQLRLGRWLLRHVCSPHLRRIRLSGCAAN